MGRRSRLIKIWLSFLAVAALSWPAWGQKVEVQKPDHGQILHVQTALNHLTVLEMTGPVSTVAVGSPVFKVSGAKNKVFIEPTETGGGDESLRLDSLGPL